MSQKKQKPPMKKVENSLYDLSEFTLLYDYVLVQAIREESVNGLVSPKQYEDKPEYGRIIAVGEGRLLDNGTVVPTKVKVGDVVFFGKYSSTQTRSKGKDYFLIRDEDVCAIAPRK